MLYTQLPHDIDQDDEAEQAELPIIGPDVKMRRVDFQTCIDCVGRACLAARQAQKLAAAAAKAFAEEAANLESVRSSLETVITLSDV